MKTIIISTILVLSTLFAYGQRYYHHDRGWHRGYYKHHYNRPYYRHYPRQRYYHEEYYYYPRHRGYYYPRHRYYRGYNRGVDVNVTVPLPRPHHLPRPHLPHHW